MNKKLKNKPKIYILGSQGYLGSNVIAHLHSQELDIFGLDSRVSDLRNCPLSKGDHVIDCSRLKSFSGASRSEDLKNSKAVLTWVNTAKAKFLRIGSALELHTESDDSPYIEWSRQRTQETTQFNKSRLFATLLVPNIYGGVKSTSVLDKMLLSYKLFDQFHLNHSNSFRDFLNINYLLQTIDSLLWNFTFYHQDVFLISSGVSHQIGSIKDYIYTNGKTAIVSKKVDYHPQSIYKLYPDILLSYIDNY